MDVRRPGRIREAGRHHGRMSLTNLAFGVQQFHALAGGGMSYGVIFALFIITHGVEGSGRRRPACWRRHAGQQRGRWQEVLVLNMGLRVLIGSFASRSLKMGARQERRVHEH
jgi:hypothetical protein